MNKYLNSFAAASLSALAWVSPVHASGQEYDFLTPGHGPNVNADLQAISGSNATAGAHAGANSNATGVGHVNTHVEGDGPVTLNGGDQSVRTNQSVQTHVGGSSFNDGDTSVNTQVGVEGSTFNDGDTSVNVEGDGAVTQNSGDQTVNVGGNSYKAGAITGAPTVFGPSNLNNCQSGFGFSIGGGNPFTGSGGVGFTFTSPAGAPVAVSAYELIEMSVEQRQQIISDAGLSETQIARLQCGLNAAYPQYLAHKQRLVEAGVTVLINGDEAWERAAGHGVIAEKDGDYHSGLSSTFKAKRELMQSGNSNASDAQLLEQMLLTND